MPLRSASAWATDAVNGHGKKYLAISDPPRVIRPRWAIIPNANALIATSGAAPKAAVRDFLTGGVSGALKPPLGGRSAVADHYAFARSYYRQRKLFICFLLTFYSSESVGEQKERCFSRSKTPR